MQRRGCADGHICETHVIVDRSDKADDAKMTVFRELVWCNFTLSVEGLEERRPLNPKDVGSRERAVTTTDDEGVDALADEVVCS